MPDDENTEAPASGDAAETTGGGKTEATDPEPAKAEATKPPEAAKPAAAGRPAVRKADTLPSARPGGLAAAGGGHQVVVVQPKPAVPTLPGLPGMPQVTRRGVMRTGFWAALGSLLGAIGITTLWSLYPRVPPVGFKGKIATVDSLVPGIPFHHLESRVWLVRFSEETAARENAALKALGLEGTVQAGAILPLAHKCPHLGCTVPWRESFSRLDPRTNATYPGWFVCPCHGSTYSAGGVRVFGPAPRSMDLVEMTIDGGAISVNTSAKTKGTTLNPTKAQLPA